MTAPGAKTGRERAGSEPGSGGWRGTRAARAGTRRAALPRAGGILAGGRGVRPVVFRGGCPVAAVWRLPGAVAVLGGHADRRLRRLCPRPPGHVAGVRVGVGLPGPPPGDPRQSGDGRGRMRVVPGSARRGDAVRRPGIAGRRCRHGDRRARCRADRPAARGQRDRAGGHHRGRPAGSGRRRAGHQRAGPVRAGADPAGLVAAARCQPGRRRRGAGAAGDRASAAGRAGHAAAAGGRAAAGPGDVRDSAAVPDRGVDAQRLLPVAGSVAGRAGGRLAGPGLGAGW